METEIKPSPREQLTFKGTATIGNGQQLCEDFVANRFKPMRCVNCGNDLRYLLLWVS